MRKPQSTDAELAYFARRVVVAVLIAVLILALVYGAWRSAYFLLLAFGGVLFALFLSALSDWLRERSGLRYGWALTIVVAGLTVVVGMMSWLLASRLALQLGQFSQELSDAFARLQEILAQYPAGRLLLEKGPDTIDLSRLTGFVSGFSHFVLAAIIVVFVGIFGAAEPARYRSGLLQLVPPPHRRRAGQAIDTVAYNLRWWLVGQSFLMVIMAVTTTLGLWLIGVPMALTLGLIAGIFEIVPYFGPWLSVIPAALIALVVSPWHLAMTLGLYLVLHVLEGYVLLPLVQRRSVHLPPALTLVAQLLLGDLLGVAGLFVAAPLTVAAVVALKMLYVEDTLGDDSVDVPGEPGNQAKLASRKTSRGAAPTAP